MSTIKDIRGTEILDSRGNPTVAATVILHSGATGQAATPSGASTGTREAVDIFNDGKTELLLTAPFVRGVSTHGTGCTYSAATAAHCAKGLELARAVQAAKQFITKAIAESRRIGRHFALGWMEGGVARRSKIQDPRSR